MSIDAIISNLGALAVVKSGYPFRGSIEEAADADALMWKTPATGRADT